MKQFLTLDNIRDIFAASALISLAEPVLPLLADTGYDADALRKLLRTQRTRPAFPGLRRRQIQGSMACGAAFSRLKGFR